MICTASRQEKRRLWQQHILALPGSGLSAAAYCRMHGLSYKSFAYWKRVLAVNASEAAQHCVHESDFEEITTVVSCAISRKMETDQSVAALRVEVGGRFRIEVAGDFSPVVLAKMVRTLEALR